MYPWVKGRIQVCSNEGLALLQAEIITKEQKYIHEINQSSSTEPLNQSQPNLVQCILG